MKIPEFAFRFINPIVKALLISPLHRLFSGSVLVLYFQGRRSGRALSTPVRYLRDGSELTLVTNLSGGWWPNFIETQRVELQLAGERCAARATAYRAPDPLVRERISRMLQTHPADAAYLDIAKSRSEDAVDGRWEPASFNTAIETAVVVLLEIVEDERR